MNLNLRVRYHTREWPWLCFRHAIRAAEAGEDVKTEIDDYGSEYYLGTTVCPLCTREAEDMEERKE